MCGGFVVQDKRYALRGGFCEKPKAASQNPFAYGEATLADSSRQTHIASWFAKRALSE